MKEIFKNSPSYTFDDALLFINTFYNISDNYSDKSLTYNKRRTLFLMEKLLDNLGNPQQKVPIIHVGGTSGKGSTCSFIGNVLINSGYKTGITTSPYVHDIRERLVINGNVISKRKFVYLIIQLKEALGVLYHKEGKMPTYFDVLVSLAWKYFADEKVDIAVMEVGMGGRLDATNVKGDTIANIITHIDFDHTEALGETRRAIAAEKIEIVRQGQSCLSSHQHLEVIEVINNYCADKKAKTLLEGRDFQYSIINETTDGIVFDFNGLGFQLKGLQTSMTGSYQGENAALAVATSLLLRDRGYKISEENIRKGLLNAKLPGRMEVLSHKPLVIFDGAHNPSKINGVLKTIKNKFDFKRLFIIAGFVGNKNWNNMVELLSESAYSIFVTRPQISWKTAADPLNVSRCAAKFCNKVETFLDPKDAFDQALQNLKDDDCLLVTGSFFLVGELLEYYRRGLHRKEKKVAKLTIL